MTEQEQKIIVWSLERGLIQVTDPKTQCVKLMEEHGELARAILRDDIGTVEDSLGDMFVVMVQIAQKYNLTMYDCIETAYEQIKDRKGRMINGSFVKNA